MKRTIQFSILCCLGLAVNSWAMGYSKDYEPCMKSAQSQIKEISACQKHESKVQNKRVKQNYKKKLSNTPSSEKQLVKQIQQDWLKQRDQVCGFEKNKFEQKNTTYTGCFLQLTMARADMLEYGLK
ncbi:lysozyme inhibitor LprI family protein [Acinetobacter sp. ANC 5378]|uniref:lysozyme inhibitor LprI family protein n=1 Tax=Acinetobacter sp. ANC 5378 TaxID=2731249 RepID=UPI0014900328|nr:lysozyme inhibitor LprI family protein [Acinetobacter sp. ANC 5378]NNG80538.1 DUF1311 domain-containing protein [Acinetobacter sp. ANC 5378]